MASINGVSSKNGVSSLYNSSKVISGLASGLDTEGMIEGLVQSYQNKITSLSQKATKVEWKQDAYRSIIAKMNSFTSKYTSFSSSTNLSSRQVRRQGFRQRQDQQRHHLGPCEAAGHLRPVPHQGQLDRRRRQEHRGHQGAGPERQDHLGFPRRQP